MTNKVTFIMAHPDDAFVWCGGIIFEFLKIKVKIAIISLSTDEENVETNMIEIAKTNNFEYKSIPKCDVNPDIISEYLSKIRPNLIFTHWSQDTHEYHRKTAYLVDIATKGYKLDVLNKENDMLNINLLQCDTYYSIGTNGDPFPGKVIVDISNTFTNKIAILELICPKYKNIIEPMVRIQAEFYGGKIGCPYGEAFLQSSSLASIGGGLGRMKAENLILV